MSSGYDEIGAAAHQSVTETPEPDYLTVTSPLSDEQVERLRAPLAPERIRRREGRGSGTFEYIAAHDAIRTANAIFGFGAWGHEIVAQERIGEVEVVSKNNKPGYHVAYRCVVRLTVRGCVPVSGTGYGDGVEYGGEAARLTASELALKESESDALKRALVRFGDQFGLILYAKVDEKKRIESDRASDESQPVVRREGPTVPVPHGWAEANDLLIRIDPDGGWEYWLNQATEQTFGKRIADLDAETRRMAAFQRVASFVVHLQESLPGDFPPPTREQIQDSIGFAYDGIEVEGPPWRLSPEETDRPTREEYDAANAPEEPVAEQDVKIDEVAINAEAEKIEL